MQLEQGAEVAVPAADRPLPLVQGGLVRRPQGAVACEGVDLSPKIIPRRPMRGSGLPRFGVQAVVATSMSRRRPLSSNARPAHRSASAPLTA